MPKQITTLMAWLRRLLTADPGPLAGGSALFVTDGRSTGYQADGRIAPRAPESRCAIPYPEPAATAAPPVPVTGGLS